jgi:hypothetical protein
MALEGLERLQVEDSRDYSPSEQIDNGDIVDDHNRTPTLVNASLIVYQKAA